MNRTLFVIALSLMTGCAHRADIQPKPIAEQSPGPIQSPMQSSVSNAAPNETTIAVTNQAPPEFHDVDFKNLTYSISQSAANDLQLPRPRVQLTEGKAEYPAKSTGGTTYDLMGVDYADLNGDSSKEAIVRLLQVSCGVSCDGGTDIFYFYTVDHGQPFLLSRLEIGSYAYDCGLKSFVLENQDLSLETYRSCKFNGSGFRPAHDDPDERGGKLMTNRYTEFTLHFDGARFVQRQRRVLWYPDEYDYRSDQRTIEIKN